MSIILIILLLAEDLYNRIQRYHSGTSLKMCVWDFRNGYWRSGLKLLWLNVSILLESVMIAMLLPY